MKFNFNKPIIDLDGEIMIEPKGKTLTMGRIIAREMSVNYPGNAIDNLELALALNRGDDVDLETSEQKTMRDFIEKDENITVLAKAQILKEFDRQQSEKTGKAKTQK